MIFLENIAFLSLVGACLVGVWYFTRSTFQFKVLINLLACGLIIDLVNLLFQPGLTDGKYFSNCIWYLCEFALIYKFFYHPLNKTQIRILAFFTLSYSFIVIQTNALDVYNPILRLHASVPLVFLSTWELYKAVKSRDLAVGIVSIGFLLYFLVTVPVFLYFNEINRSIWVAHSCLSILMNISIGGGIYVNVRKSKLRNRSNSFYNRGGLPNNRGDSLGSKKI